MLQWPLARPVSELQANSYATTVYLRQRTYKHYMHCQPWSQRRYYWKYDYIVIRQEGQERSGRSYVFFH